MSDILPGAEGPPLAEFKADSIEATQDPEQVFSYTHNDGQEVAGTLEQARSVCPELGRMSIENVRLTLQESDMAARVAQRGRERKLREAAKLPENERQAEKASNPQLQNPKANKGNEPSQKAAASKTFNKEYGVPAANTYNEALIHELERLAAVIGVHDDDIKEPTALEVKQDGLRDEFLHHAFQAMSAYQDQGEPGPRVDARVTEVKDASPQPIDPKVKIVDISSEDKESYPVVAQEITGQVVGTSSPVNSEPSKAEVYDEQTTEPKITNITSQPEEPTEIYPLEVISTEGPEATEITQSIPAIPDEKLPMDRAEPPNWNLESRGVDIISEVVDPQGENASHDLLEADYPILWMAGLEESAPEVGEADEPPLFESLIIAEADTIDSESTPIEAQPIIPMPELEDLTELPSPPEAIEATITLLAKALELVGSEPEPEADKPQEIYQILEAIITLPDSLEAIAGETEEAIEQKLEELFVELFDQTGVEHTPELIKSFVKLTQAHYLSQLIETAKQDKPQGQPSEIGTREFLQKLRHGLSGLKQAATHFYEIGQSALRLYALDRAVPQLA